MELFKLLGTIAVENTDAVKAIKETSGEGEKAESKLSNAFDKIGSAAVKVGKAVATGFGVAATAMGTITTMAVKNYADYEQLVGGVETLFGAGGKSLGEYAASVGQSVSQAKKEYDSLKAAQNTVLRNADAAFKTAGLSANEYMETVTSFSASLIQSLGGDTKKAAEAADQATNIPAPATAPDELHKESSAEDMRSGEDQFFPETFSHRNLSELKQNRKYHATAYFCHWQSRSACFPVHCLPAQACIRMKHFFRWWRAGRSFPWNQHTRFSQYHLRNGIWVSGNAV